MEGSRFSGLSNPEILELGRKIAEDINLQVSKVAHGPELQALTDILTLAVLTNSHVVVRAPVGLGKTLTCSAFARAIGGVSKRHQFTPDLMPAAITGFQKYNQKTQEFEIHHGPLFGTNIFLADEINRSTPKTQSALLGAMEERQVTIDSQLFNLPTVFVVLATRNSVEHEGTYDLPEAQLDRFLAQVSIDSISKKTGMQVLGDKDYWRVSSNRLARVNAVTNPDEIVELREVIFTTIHVEERLEDYIWRLRDETWKHPKVAFGSSPRGAINLKMAATVVAFRDGRDYVTPEDVKRYALEILSHRVFLKSEYRYTTKAIDIVREVINDIKPD